MAEDTNKFAKLYRQPLLLNTKKKKVTLLIKLKVKKKKNLLQINEVGSILII